MSVASKGSGKKDLVINLTSILRVERERKLCGSRFINDWEEARSNKREIMRSHNAELDLWMSSLTNAQIVYRPTHILNY
jgi:hypothetical protein